MLQTSPQVRLSLYVHQWCSAFFSKPAAESLFSERQMLATVNCSCLTDFDGVLIVLRRTVVGDSGSVMFQGIHVAESEEFSSVDFHKISSVSTDWSVDWS